MKYAEHVDYTFTNEDNQFLITDKSKSTGTCVIDNFIGLYVEELKLTRGDFIKLHQDYYKNVFVTSSDLDDGVASNDSWRLEDGITSIFLEHVCKLYDISHYAYDINNECFMKYVSKNINHASLIYYDIKNHMYLVFSIKKDNKKY